ncbi:MAG TPA: HIT family protein [Candidatus Binataceae bacterium]|nr:HIT family protein [Candidatus Binataceae bacterium]
MAPRADVDDNPRRCGICALIERARDASFADFVAELPNSWVILGDAQFYRGYCVLLAKTHATEMHLLEPPEARALFDEVLAVGRAIALVTKPLKLNYECLGNVEPHVHWHVFPRYESDPMRLAPIWTRPEAERKVSLDETARHALAVEIGRALMPLKPGARVASR